MPIFVLSLYCLWFLLTVLAQFHIKLSRKIRQYDYFKIFPNWSLFFPSLEKYDYLFCYRDEINNTLTAYIEIEIKETNRLAKIICNPARRKTHMLQSIADRIENWNGPTDKIKTGLAYKAMVNYAKQNHPAERGAGRQFVIFIVKGGFKNPGEPQLLIASDFYHAQ
jgi:hypothetical protein